MDLSKIKSAVLNQLTNTNGLYSLKIQNHIYGCFLMMEDIAQKAISVSGTVISAPKFSFDFDKQFGEIGIRYGFAMDTKLILDNYQSEYKSTWLQYFKDIDLSQDISEVDKIEDSLIQIIQENVKPEDAFFLNATETGSLSQEWIDKVLLLLNPPAPPPSPSDKEEEIKTAVSQAVTEKPLNTRRRLATTRRANKPGVATTTKKTLARTRRHFK
jgi:hypothetical protein